MELKEEVEFLKKNGYLEIDVVETISFKVNKDINNKLDELAKIKQTTKSMLIRASLDHFVVSATELNRDTIRELSEKALEKPLSVVSLRLYLSDVLKIDKKAKELNLDRSDMLRYAVYKLLEKNKMI